jgi:hypothetical protein
MRECPPWFQRELTRIGGVNHYGEPIFKLVWSTIPRMTIGGFWAQTGFVGYRQVPMIQGPPCWSLLVWEPREVQGSLIAWERQFTDSETGLLQCGGYPKYGKYRLLQKFMHRELVDGELRTYRMEPCGLMIDLMLPMLIRWRKLSDDAKVKALLAEEQEKNDDLMRKVKNIREASKLSPTMRGSQFVQKRAEIIERGFRQAMAMAAQTGLGMRMEN